MIHFMLVLGEFQCGEDGRWYPTLEYRTGARCICTWNETSPPSENEDGALEASKAEDRVGRLPLGVDVTTAGIET